MELAILARPQWRTPLEGTPAPSQDPRVIAAPLQELVLLKADSMRLQSHLVSSNSWLVFTSPASVIALSSLAKQWALDLSTCPSRYVAVGHGTRDQLLRTFHHLSQAQIVVSADAQTADAAHTLMALDAIVASESLQWGRQKFLLIEGCNNRPTLRDGLIARGTHAESFPIYERIDVDWPKGLWQQLARAKPGEVGIVMTSTTVIDRILQLMKARGLHPSGFRWCTQHFSIANKLMHEGLGPIIRVRLDAQHLTSDLFSHGNHW